MRTRLILNADDFGRSFSINQAVIRAHREGVLTSASLMVTGDAADEAVTLARRTPTLAVGLHLVLAGGRPALPAAAIPHLLDPRGLLPADPAAAGARYVLSRSARAELAREVEAQFGLFAATGLPLDHVNGHMHLHLIPGLFAIVAHSAAEHGAGESASPATTSGCRSGMTGNRPGPSSSGRRLSAPFTVARLIGWRPWNAGTVPGKAGVPPVRPSPTAFMA